MCVCVCLCFVLFPWGTCEHGSTIQDGDDVRSHGDTGWCPQDNLWDQLAWNVEGNQNLSRKISHDQLLTCVCVCGIGKNLFYGIYIKTGNDLCRSQHATGNAEAPKHRSVIAPELLDPGPWRTHDHTLDELHSCPAPCFAEFPRSVASYRWGPCCQVPGLWRLWPLAVPLRYWQRWSSKPALNLSGVTTQIFKAHSILRWHTQIFNKPRFPRKNHPT